MTLTLEAQPHMTRRPPVNISAHRRAAASTLVATARKSGKRTLEARQNVAALAWQARVSGDWAGYREIMRHLRDLRGRTKAEHWKDTPSGHATARHFLTTSPAQREREAVQRAEADASPARQAELVRQRQRDRERLATNALATALWAIHQGHRDWTPLVTRSGTSSAPPSENPGTRPAGPAVLHVEVPATRFGPAHRLDLFKADYDRLLGLWGYGTVVQASRLADSLKAGSLKGSVHDQAVGALLDLAAGSATRPNLARSWHAYVTGSRLGDIFAEHSSGTVQLAPRRNGDLREAAEEIYRQARVVWPQPAAAEDA